MRYTSKNADACFKRLCGILGKQVATEKREPGSWYLDCNHVYGGYVVYEFCNKHGGVSEPMGSARRSAREFCEAVWFAECALGVRGKDGR